MTQTRILIPCAKALAGLAFLLAGTAVADEHLATSPVHQLRIYDINTDNRQAFHDRFRDHAARIMAKYDFHIIAMWESRFDGRTEFVYLLEWPDRETMTEQWAAFMADEEWANIKQETGRVHGTFVNDIQDRMLVLTRYSPSTTFLAPKADAKAGK